jgi:hypothetical protein
VWVRILKKSRRKMRGRGRQGEEDPNMKKKCKDAGTS